MVMGPYCTQIMADMGADVIKIEPPEGDNTRYISVGSGAGHERRVRQRQPRQAQRRTGSAHRGRQAALAGADRPADVFIHSMRAKAIAKLGFGYDEVAAINPAIVYTNCYGYGRRGPEPTGPPTTTPSRPNAACPRCSSS